MRAVRSGMFPTAKTMVSNIVGNCIKAKHEKKRKEMSSGWFNKSMNQSQIGVNSSRERFCCLVTSADVLEDFFFK